MDAVDTLRRLSRRAVRKLVGRGTRQIERPNAAHEWEAEVLEPIVPVRGLRHPVARAVCEITEPGDVLLEAGCGSGVLSAELAHEGRKIQLLDFSERILARVLERFEASGLAAPEARRCDLTEPPMPWPDGAVDWVWSSGVLEHWTDEELVPIVAEMRRVARKGVISLVPNAGSLFYRWGKQAAEEAGTWPYGRELPRESLRAVFEEAGLPHVEERDCWRAHGPEFLKMLGVRGAYESGRAFWDALPATDPVRAGQGYLLLTVGRKSAP